jgi:hypothetical protein
MGLMGNTTRRDEALLSLVPQHPSLSWIRLTVQQNLDINDSEDVSLKHIRPVSQHFRSHSPSIGMTESRYEWKYVGHRCEGLVAPRFRNFSLCNHPNCNVY